MLINARYLADLTSAELPAMVKHSTVVWGVGSIEQHGPHLPLSVDFDIAASLSEAVAARLDNAYLAPAQAFGARSLPQSGGGLFYPGTLYLTGSTLIDYLQEIITGLAQLECSHLLIINGHYENEAFLFEAIDHCRQAGQLTHIRVSAFSWWSLVQADWICQYIGPRFPGWHAEHAGLTETSLMLYLRPDVVRVERPVHDTPPLAGLYSHPSDPGMTSNNGVLSSTLGSSMELGKALFEHVVEQVLKHATHQTA